MLCHEQKMPVIRRHVVFDGIKETEIKKREMKRIGADSTDVWSSLCLKHTCVDEAFLSCCRELQEHGRTVPQ